MRIIGSRPLQNPRTHSGASNTLFWFSTSLQITPDSTTMASNSVIKLTNSVQAATVSTLLSATPIPKQRERPNGSKNKPSALPLIINAPPPSSVPAAIATTHHGRQIKEKRVWEQGKGHSQSFGQWGRQRGDSLEAILSLPKKKKSSETSLVDAIDVDEWERVTEATTVTVSIYSGLIPLENL